MAFSAGKNASFQITDSGASNRDISAYVKDVKHNFDVGMADTTTLGASAKTFIPTLKDGKLTLSGLWDPTLDGYLAPLVGFATASTFIFGPAGTTSGYVKYTGSAFVMSYEVSAPVGDVVTWSATIQCTGAVSRTTF
jgi:hypothetical protein